MKITCRPLVIAVLLSPVPMSIIAAPVAPDAGLLMRESSKMPTAPKKPIEALVEQPALKKPMATQSTLTIAVRSFRFIGNSQIPASVLQTLLSGYTNRKLNFADLQQAAAVITEYYRKQGFIVAYAYLPEQTLEQGEVELAIIEGRLDDQHLKGQLIPQSNDIRIHSRVLKDFLATLPKGSLITENNMNHLSLLLNQLPGINAKVVLAPGKETGTSTLAAKIKEGPLITGSGSTDNYGLYATGYYRFNGGLSINDPFGQGDQLNLRAQTTETGDAVAGWADYSMAINGYGTRLGLNFAELDYTLGRSFSALDASGIARSVGTTISQPLLLQRNAQLSGFAHYEHRWMEDKNGLEGSHNNRELDTMSYSLSGMLSDSLLPTTGITQAFINVTAGQVDFTNRQAFLNDQSSLLHTSGAYHKFNWSLNRTQPIWGPLTFYANFQGQIASKNLDSSEQISLGGPYNIRAYPVGEGSADEGWQINTELRYRLPTLSFLPGYQEVIAFIDTGYARVNTERLAGDEHNTQHLTGYGFGINWSEIEGFNLRTSLAWRDGSKRPSADPTVNGPVAYFQLARQF